MEGFESDVPIAVDPTRAMEAFWRLERWPEIAPHVQGIDLHYSDDNVQVLTMTVNTRGNVASFKTVRTRQSDLIFYYQPSPPPILHRHYGWWAFTETPQGCVVTSRHMVDINDEAAARFLEGLGVEVEHSDLVRREITELIRGNSRQTMLAVKGRLEAGE